MVSRSVTPISNQGFGKETEKGVVAEDGYGANRHPTTTTTVADIHFAATLSRPPSRQHLRTYATRHKEPKTAP